MVLTFFLCFDLHDNILYKTASYKYLKKNNPNTINYDPDNKNIEPLSDYINELSLTNDYVKIVMTEGQISISSESYNGNITSSYFDKCKLLRMSSVATDFLK